MTHPTQAAQQHTSHIIGLFLAPSCPVEQVSCENYKIHQISEQRSLSHPLKVPNKKAIAMINFTLKLIFHLLNKKGNKFNHIDNSIRLSILSNKTNIEK